jgi:hypothetical protein
MPLRLLALAPAPEEGRLLGAEKIKRVNSSCSHRHGHSRRPHGQGDCGEPVHTLKTCITNNSKSS